MLRKLRKIRRAIRLSNHQRKLNDLAHIEWANSLLLKDYPL